MIIVFNYTVADFFGVPYDTPIQYDVLETAIMKYVILHGPMDQPLRRVLDLNRTMPLRPDQIPYYVEKYIEDYPEELLAQAQAQAQAQART
jgi:hypothetical protein